MDWLTAKAADLGRAIGKGDIDPVALTECYLDAIASSPVAAQIYARVTPELARAQAQAAAHRAREGRRYGVLDGVPVSWKDLIDSAMVGTEAGTALMAGRVPQADAPVLAQGSAAGLVCLGKTHMSEIAFSGLGYNPVLQTSPNVFEADWAPGGSSSGAGASLAFGLAAGAIGSDTGGSIRVPSAWQGLVGYKPVHGTHSLQGVVPLCRAFDTIGPLARSVEDAVLLNAALGAKSVDLADSSLNGAKFAVLETVVLEALAPEVARSFEAALQCLEAQGATITRFTFDEMPRAFDLAGILYNAEAWAFWRDYITPAPEKMFHQILERVSGGADVLAADYIAGWDLLREIRARFEAKVAEFDAVLCPTVAILPPQVSRLGAEPDYYKERNLLALRNTRMANLMGLASVQLPLEERATGLMLSAPASKEGQLLRLAAAAEAALG